jgi:hypothetical protein
MSTPAAHYHPAVSLHLLACELRDLAAAAALVFDDETRAPDDRAHAAALHLAYSRAYRMAARAERDALAWMNRQEGGGD